LCYGVKNMSSTFTVRIPRELKEKMKKLPVEWSEEVRRFIEEKVRRLELMGAIEEIELRVEKRRLRVNSTKLIREDRER